MAQLVKFITDRGAEVFLEVAEEPHGEVSSYPKAVTMTERIVEAKAKLDEAFQVALGEKYRGGIVRHVSPGSYAG